MRLAPEQKAALLASFKESPRPTVQARKELAGTLGLEYGTVSNWFEAERKRTGLGVLPKADKQPTPSSAAGDATAEAADASAMRKRKAAAASGYEAPTDEASRAALVAALAEEERRLSACVASPPADLSSHLPPLTAALGAGPQLQRAVRALSFARAGSAIACRFPAIASP